MNASIATLCSLALCLWGYQTGAWAIALPMVAALEARHWVKRRWRISEIHFQTVHGIAGFLWLLSLFHVPLNSPTAIPYTPLYHILKCLPVGLFPLVLAQTYSPNFTALYATVFGSSSPSRPGRSRPVLNLYYPYFGICLLAASVTGGNIPLFLSLTALLVAGLLGTWRSPRFSPGLFYGLMGLALILSLLGTYQFHWLQANVKLNGSELFSTLLQKLADASTPDTSQRSKPPFEVSARSTQSQRQAETARALESAIENAEGASSGGASPQSDGMGNAATGSSAPALPLSPEGTAALQKAIQNTLQAEGNGLPTGNLGGVGSVNAASPPPATPPAQAVPPPAGGTDNSAATPPPQKAHQPSTQTVQPPAAPSSPGINPPPSGTNTGSSGSFTSPGTQQGVVQQGIGEANPQTSQTQMGRASAIQLSDAIVFRVAPLADPRSKHPGFTLPLYIREAAYNQYREGGWNAVQPEFTSQAPLPQTQRWRLGIRTPHTTTVRISTPLRQPDSVLKLPVGTSDIDHLAVDALQVNQYGTVKVQGTPGNLAYTVQFDPTQLLDRPPTPPDREVPISEQPVLSQILQSLNLQGKSDLEVIESVAAFFRKNFQYSLTLPPPSETTTPLATFLLKNRAGHCEYFATATALLLRAAGIPTRYVVGYTAQEYSPTEQQYVVRARNAHAWVMAYRNGAWATVENTPPDGLAQGANRPTPEQENPSAQPSPPAKPVQNPPTARPKAEQHPAKTPQSFSQAVADAVASLKSFLVEHHNTVLWASLIIGVGLVIIGCSLGSIWAAMRHRRQFQRSERRYSGAERLSSSQADSLGSEFYLIENRLRDWGLERKPSETLRHWMGRLSQTLPDTAMETLSQILDLHYRDRFDPQGLVPEERVQMRSMIQSWLKETPASSL